MMNDSHASAVASAYYYAQQANPYNQAMMNPAGVGPTGGDDRHAAMMQSVGVLGRPMGAAQTMEPMGRHSMQAMNVPGPGAPGGVGVGNVPMTAAQGSHLYGQGLAHQQAQGVSGGHSVPQKNLGQPPMPGAQATAPGSVHLLPQHSLQQPPIGLPAPAAVKGSVAPSATATAQGMRPPAPQGAVQGGGSSLAEQQLANFTALLKARLARVAADPEHVDLVQTCLRELQDTIWRLGPTWVLRPFGSIANGFGTIDSDIDATCFRTDVNRDTLDPQLAQQELIQKIEPLLREHPRFEITGSIPAARVPLLRLRFDGTLDVDLSCYNNEPLPNTQLLRAYSELDASVAALGVLIKLWAKGNGVSGAKQGHLSSYSLTLMTIYFLQVEVQVKCPCLPVWAFTGEGGTPPPAKSAAAGWSCSAPLPMLLARFFQFYAYDFHWGQEVVAIQVGQRTTNAEETFRQLRGRWLQRLHIIDPFLAERNLNCVLGTDQENILYNKICEAAVQLSQGQLPHGLISPQDSQQALVTSQAASRQAAWSAPAAPSPVFRPAAAGPPVPAPGTLGPGLPGSVASLRPLGNSPPAPPKPATVPSRQTPSAAGGATSQQLVGPSQAPAPSQPMTQPSSLQAVALPSQAELPNGTNTTASTGTLSKNTVSGPQALGSMSASTNAVSPPTAPSSPAKTGVVKLGQKPVKITEKAAGLAPDTNSPGTTTLSKSTPLPTDPPVPEEGFFADLLGKESRGGGFEEDLRRTKEVQIVNKAPSDVESFNRGPLPAARVHLPDLDGLPDDLFAAVISVALQTRPWIQGGVLPPGYEEQLSLGSGTAT